MFALTHRLEAVIDRQFGFTRGRITQLMDLTLLAPDIQEQVLDLEAVDGREALTERGLREVVGLVDWGEQRERWDGLCQQQPTSKSRQPC
jgi:hypothetical protein